MKSIFCCSLYSRSVICYLGEDLGAMGKCNTLLNSLNRPVLEQMFVANLTALPHSAACEDIAANVFDAIFTGTTDSAGIYVSPVEMFSYCV